MDSREEEYYQWNQHGDQHGNPGPGRWSEDRGRNGDGWSWGGADPGMEWTGGQWAFGDAGVGSYSADPYREWGGTGEGGGPVMRDGDPVSGEGDPEEEEDGVDVDGEPVEMGEDVQELTRKKMELRSIEEQIILKKASIAMKQIAPILRAMEAAEGTNKAFSGDAKEEEAENRTPEHLKGVPFKDRIAGILLKREKPQKRPAAAPPRGPKVLLQPPKMVKSFVERMNASILNKDGRLKDGDEEEEDHPLKLRVRRLMAGRRNRVAAPPSNEEVPEVAPEQNHVEPDQDQDQNQDQAPAAAKGFQRFLSILNSGVDFDLMSKIVNDIPPTAPTPAEPTYGGDRDDRGGGGSPRDHGGSESSERRGTPAAAAATPPGDERRRSGSSRGRSESPAAPARSEEDGGQKYGGMQDLLQTIGLDLGLEEMDRLTSRIQERLYGRKEADGGERKGAAPTRKQTDPAAAAPSPRAQPIPTVSRHASASATSATSAAYAAVQPPQHAEEDPRPDAEPPPPPPWGYGHEAVPQTAQSPYPPVYPSYPPPDLPYDLGAPPPPAGHALAFHQPPYSHHPPPALHPPHPHLHPPHPHLHPPHPHLHPPHHLHPPPHHLPHHPPPPHLHPLHLHPPHPPQPHHPHHPHPHPPHYIRPPLHLPQAQWGAGPRVFMRERVLTSIDCEIKEVVMQIKRSRGENMEKTKKKKKRVRNEKSKIWAFKYQEKLKNLWVSKKARKKMVLEMYNQAQKTMVVSDQSKKTVPVSDQSKTVAVSAVSDKGTKETEVSNVSQDQAVKEAVCIDLTGE